MSTFLQLTCVATKVIQSKEKSILPHDMCIQLKKEMTSNLVLIRVKSRIDRTMFQTRKTWT